MDISLLGNINAVNRGLLTDKHDPSDKEVRESSQSAKKDELLSRESQISPVPPVQATADIPNQKSDLLPEDQHAGKQINIKV